MSGITGDPGRQLTPRQAEVLAAIREYRAEHGRSPTYRELSRRFGFVSNNGADCHVRALVAKGALRRVGPVLSRALVPTDEAPRDPVPAPAPAEAADESALTGRQAEVLHLIRESLATRGVAPTLHELQVTLGIASPHGITCHLRSLVKKGFLVRTSNIARALVPAVPGEARP